MELIERYIHAVTQQLPEAMKDDVAKELRGNIEDMLPEQYTEEEVKAVLEELGNPWKIAEEYQPKPRYLIGPALYSKYFTVLRLVVGIVITVLAVVTILGWVFTPPTEWTGPDYYVDMFVELIVALINGGLQAALWVTLVFVAIERGWFGMNSGSSTEKESSWSIRELPQLPVQSKRIPRSSSITSIVASLLFTAVIVVRPELLGIHTRGADGQYSHYPLLDVERVQFYLPLIIIITIAYVILFVWKYIVPYWTYRLWSAHIILSLLSMVLLLVMVNDPSLLREGFLQDAAQSLNISQAKAISGWDNIIRVLSAAIVIITIWDGIDTWLKARKK